MLASPHIPFPQLERIVEMPVFGADGTLLRTHGYHSATRIFLATEPGISTPTVMTTPTDDDVRCSLAMLRYEFISDFPFVSPSDQAHALALSLLPFARDLISGPTPLHLIEAPCSGTGKGLLAETLLGVAHGTQVTIMPQARDDEEWRKRLTACYREGRPVILVDNLTRPLESGVLAAALTANMWEDRLLGKSETVRIPIRAIHIATANNPLLSTEMVRRSIRIRLDSNSERPWLRSGFKHSNLKVWVQEQRPRLMRSVLTLIQNWVVRGKPPCSGKVLALMKIGHM